VCRRRRHSQMTAAGRHLSHLGRRRVSRRRTRLDWPCGDPAQETGGRLEGWNLGGRRAAQRPWTGSRRGSVQRQRREGTGAGARSRPPLGCWRGSGRRGGVSWRITSADRFPRSDTSWSSSTGTSRGSRRRRGLLPDICELSDRWWRRRGLFRDGIPQHPSLPSLVFSSGYKQALNPSDREARDPRARRG